MKNYVEWLTDWLKEGDRQKRYDEGDPSIHDEFEKDKTLWHAAAEKDPVLGPKMRENKGENMTRPKKLLSG